MSSDSLISSDTMFSYGEKARFEHEADANWRDIESPTMSLRFMLSILRSTVVLAPLAPLSTGGSSVVSSLGRRPLRQWRWR